MNGIYVWHTVTENRYIILEGLCSSVDKTPLRKRVKNIYLETEAGTVKIVIRQCIKQMEKGIISEYISLNIHLSMSMINVKCYAVTLHWKNEKGEQQL